MTFHIQSKLLLALVGVGIMTSLWQPVSSHGRLIDPPSRSSMWRYGYSTPHNYNDNELFCGGFQHQVTQGYKCGICGDPWDGKRENEAGGKYGRGIIVDTYKQGEEITIKIDLTANHKGWFEFKICPTNDPAVRATQECLDLYPLQLSDGSGTKFTVTTEMGAAELSIPVQLPETLSCEHCVLQWHYHTGNSWGTDPDGKGCIGCGNQEEFYGCSDVKILSDGDFQTSNSPRGSGTDSPTSQRSTTTTSTTTTQRPATTSTTTTVRPSTTTTTTTATATTRRTSTTTTTNNSNGGNSNVPQIQFCIQLRARMGEGWCNSHCNIGYCPPTHCSCTWGPEPRALAAANLPAGCYAKTPFQSLPGYDEWCGSTCHNGVCPSDNQYCFCIN